MKFKIFCLLFFLILISFYSLNSYCYEGSHHGILECSNCHTDFPYANYTAQGNVNLCLSCHTGGATASNLALYSVDQATITPGLTGGVYGKSHRWDAVALQVDISTEPGKVIEEPGVTVITPGGTTIQILYHRKYSVAKAFSDVNDSKIKRIACSSCHNRNTASFIRNEEERDEKLCKDCHKVDQWHGSDKGSVTTYTAGQKMNHPTKKVGANWIGCSSCHVMHAK